MSSVLDRLYARSAPWLQSAFLNGHALRVHFHRYGVPFRRQRQWLLSRERLSRDEIRNYQDSRIRLIVDWAANNSPYYRELFRDNGLDARDIRGVEDLSQIPILTKEVLRARASDLVTRERPRRSWLNGHTSGTTGSPLSVWYDRDTCILNNAVDWRHKAWAGAQPADWFGMLLGRTIVPPRTPRPPFWRTNYLQRHIWFSSFHLTEQWLPLYVNEMRKRGLRFLEGYPSTLYVLAKHLVESGKRLPLAAVISSSETLHQAQREIIEGAFECRLFDFYASAERVVFAAECEEHAGKHIAEEFGYAEVVDESGRHVPDGALGYLVGTTLHNTAMPLLRYKIGDASAIRAGQCPCGRTSRLMEDVTTKAEDFVVTPDGRVISPSILTHPFKPLEQIAKSQIVQDRPGHVLIRLVVTDQFRPEHRATLVAALKERLGEEMLIDIELVPDIPREPSGKYRWVISRVPFTSDYSWEEPTT